MKKIAIMIIFFFIICSAVWLPAGLEEGQIKQIPPKKVLKLQDDDLQAKVDRLEKELELLKRVIRINGANVDIQTVGNVKISASSISVEAVANAQLKGAMVTVQSSGRNTIKGMPVMIN
jgi:hypothetical protein